jgi:hypothetical protein
MHPSSSPLGRIRPPGGPASVLKSSQPQGVGPASLVQVMPYWRLPRSCDAKQA